ncbi:uncharacterized protein LOC119094299 [Pollicipes pollicipes]|uniref:uncharacterized protein LOC119094299 n=1 Tax=Pollicipes pollicipes TaxID=41117 RepID=UPI0018855648|nr:uncharacterized protein LOC119094299 [Pollicipes pollicipes]
MTGSQRMFLVDGQAVYLEGLEGGGDISEDVLQQALVQLADDRGEVEPASDMIQDAQRLEVGDEEPLEEDGEGVLAVLQDEAGQQQTVHLTPSQAEVADLGPEPVRERRPSVGERSTAQEVASLASSVVLDLNEQPSLVDQSVGGHKVTYTFEVVDDKDAAPVDADRPVGMPGLLAKTREIMTPRVRAGDARQIQQQIHRTAAQVLRTTTPSAPVPRDPVTGGYLSAAKVKRGPVYNTGPNAVKSKNKTVINTASSVQEKTTSAAAAATATGTAAGTAAAAAATGATATVTANAAAAGGAPSSTPQPDEDDDDLPVILTPMNGEEQLPDFIEPRPGLRILVRPLEASEDSGGGGGGGGGGAAPCSRPPGSSNNPIQLVQQGNTFKSLQPLSAEQLKQIAAVLQQSRLNVPSHARNSLYDADTNTRVVYRVVYPDDVGRAGGGRGRGRGRPRGAGRPRRTVDDADADWWPEMTRAEKAERKRSATKTRTGRLSKPPKHMVKDYRHIHRLDFNSPDLDDSDGGYSDWEDGDAANRDRDGADTGGGGSAAGEGDEERPASTLKPKRQLPQTMRDRFTCLTCGALCIGYIRLEGHFRKFPDHERPVYTPVKSAQKAPTRTPGRRGGRQRRTDDKATVTPLRPPSKRPRLEPDPEDDEHTPPMTSDQLLATLAVQSGGSIERLCDSMLAVVARFREHVRTALCAADGQQSGGVLLTMDADKSALTGLPTGEYALRSSAQPTPDTGQSTVGPAEAVVLDAGPHVLDEFVGGLVDAAGYAFAADGGVDPPAAGKLDGSSVAGLETAQAELNLTGAMGGASAPLLGPRP